MCRKEGAVVLPVYPSGSARDRGANRRRWAELAVATLSLGWNFPGRAWDAEFFAAYGVEPDQPRIDYYRRLWQAS
jgi:aminoglycoside phosphotransferase